MPVADLRGLEEHLLSIAQGGARPTEWADALGRFEAGMQFCLNVAAGKTQKPPGVDSVTNEVEGIWSLLDTCGVREMIEEYCDVAQVWNGSPDAEYIAMRWWRNARLYVASAGAAIAALAASQAAASEADAQTVYRFRNRFTTVWDETTLRRPRTNGLHHFFVDDFDAGRIWADFWLRKVGMMLATHIERSVTVPIALDVGPVGLVEQVELNVLRSGYRAELIEHPSTALLPIGADLIHAIEQAYSAFGPDASICWKLTHDGTIRYVHGPSLGGALACAFAALKFRLSIDRSVIVMANVGYGEGPPSLIPVGGMPRKLSAAETYEDKRLSLAVVASEQDGVGTRYVRAGSSRFARSGGFSVKEVCFVQSAVPVFVGLTRFRVWLDWVVAGSWWRTLTLIVAAFVVWYGTDSYFVGTAGFVPWFLYLAGAILMIAFILRWNFIRTLSAPSGVASPYYDWQRLRESFAGSTGKPSSLSVWAILAAFGTAAWSRRAAFAAAIFFLAGPCWDRSLPCQCDLAEWLNNRWPSPTRSELGQLTTCGVRSMFLTFPQSRTPDRLHPIRQPSTANGCETVRGSSARYAGGVIKFTVADAPRVSRRVIAECARCQVVGANRLGQLDLPLIDGTAEGIGIVANPNHLDEGLGLKLQVRDHRYTPLSTIFVESTIPRRRRN